MVLHPCPKSCRLASARWKRAHKKETKVAFSQRRRAGLMGPSDGPPPEVRVVYRLLKTFKAKDLAASSRQDISFAPGREHITSNCFA